MDLLNYGCWQNSNANEVLQIVGIRDQKINMQGISDEEVREYNLVMCANLILPVKS